ncbi:uncharacterized protein VP01_5361g1, partial [Puccinia sorghi]
MTQARLDATAGQQNPVPAPTLASNPLIGLHAVTSPHASKVVFAILFMKDYTATWSQPYLDKVFNGEPVVFNDFLNNFRSSLFDHNHSHHAKPTYRTLTSTPTPWVGPTPPHEPLPEQTQGEHPACRAMTLKAKESDKTAPPPPLPQY